MENKNGSNNSKYVVIRREEYDVLLRESEQISILKRYIKSSDYINSGIVDTILGIGEENDDLSN